MWFEILLIFCMGAVLFRADQKSGLITNEKKLYTAVLIFIPVLYILLYRVLFSVRAMIVAYFFVFLLLFGEKLIKLTGNIQFCVSYILKTVMVVLLYLIVITNYRPEKDGSEWGVAEVRMVFMLLSVVFIFSDKIKNWAFSKKYNVYIGILTVSTPVCCFYLIESVQNEKLDFMEWQYAVGNILWIAVLFSILYCILPWKKAAIGLAVTISFVFGLGNYYVTQFRGSPVMPADLLSAGTAFQVAGEYEYRIFEPIMKAGLCWYAGMVVLCCVPEHIRIRNWKIKAVINSFAVCICVSYLSSTVIEDLYGFQFTDAVQCWVNNFYNEKGSVLGFTVFYQNMKVNKPDGYSKERAEEILNLSPAKAPEQSLHPTIIAIMDEAFSDLRILGDFECSEEYLGKWYAVEDYLCRGNMYVSTWGGRTANTEFEFLTGNSLGSCPAGIVPYQSYNMKNVGNLADVLQKNGYHTIAVHPQNKGNWGRIRAYPNLGFQSFLGLEDFEEPMCIRSHVSDESCFDKIIDIYEKRDSNQFIFNVTMQNHSGYNVEDMSEFDLVKLKETDGNDTDVETYLTLIRESDKAIHKLFKYFKNVKEPVIICIFGDHLPNVNGDWIERVMGKSEEMLSLEEMESKYAVPYMIWANYETVYKQCEMDTSANYLGALLLEHAGIQQTAYTNFLLHMREHVPVINAFGYQMQDGSWHSFDEKTEVSEWIDDYRILQYNAMFDPERNMENYR